MLLPLLGSERHINIGISSSLASPLVQSSRKFSYYLRRTPLNQVLLYRSVIQVPTMSNKKEPEETSLPEEILDYFEPSTEHTSLGSIHIRIVGSETWNG